MAMKHQNKSIFSIFTFSMVVLDGAHSYLKFDMVMGLDTKLPQDDAFCYFINSGSWKLSKAHFPIFGHIVPCLLVHSSESFALNKVENGYFMQKIQQINLDKSDWSLFGKNMIFDYSRGSART